MPTKSLSSNQLPSDVAWLADAPLFIDAEQVERFYDAVVRPETVQGTTTLAITEQTVDQLRGQFGLEASASPGDLLKKLAAFLPFLLTAEVGASGEAEYQRDTAKQHATTIELHQINTPQRQLVQLTLHYLVNLQNRLFFVNNPSDEEWRMPQVISSIPRELVFLDLPGQEEARERHVPETKLIPTAAEFENGKIELLYKQLKSRDQRVAPPDYPEKADTLEDLREARDKYWRWFDVNFSATQATIVVEEAAARNGRIRWIDYRVPITGGGESLHLHVRPAGNYDTGTFAYNFVKRGYKHGLRLVGTLKSEPDMNVLAIYEK